MPTTNTTTIPAARCQRCGERFAPPRTRCPHCRSADIERFEAGPGGILYSHSTVHVGPGAQQPYTLGYVDLDGGPRVLARVRTTNPEALPCDAPVVVVTAEQDEQGHGRPLRVVAPLDELEGSHGD